MLSDVCGISAMALWTPDARRMRAHYEEVLGLVVTHETAGGEVYLSAGAEHHCLVLRPGSSRRLERVALRLAPDVDVETVAARLRDHGAHPELLHDPEPGVTAAVDFEDGAGNAMRLALLDDGPGPGAAERGIVPEKLGHLAHRVEHVAEIATWYEQALNFKVADWIGDFFVFMRCGPEHHVLNFIRAHPFGEMHHVGYQLSDPAHLLTASDRLARAGIPVIWGPGRHGAGHNMYIYYRDPDDHIVELFCQLDLMLDERLGAYDPRPWHVDRPQRPKVWDDHLAGANLWGIGPPEEIRRAPKTDEEKEER